MRLQDGSYQNPDAFGISPTKSPEIVRSQDFQSLPGLRLILLPASGIFHRKEDQRVHRNIDGRDDPGGEGRSFDGRRRHIEGIVIIQDADQKQTVPKIANKAHQCAVPLFISEGQIPVHKHQHHQDGRPGMMHHTQNRRQIQKRRILTDENGIEGGDGSPRQGDQPNEMQDIVVLFPEKDGQGQNIAGGTAEAVGQELLPIGFTVFIHQRQPVGKNDQKQKGRRDPDHRIPGFPGFCEFLRQNADRQRHQNTDGYVNQMLPAKYLRIHTLPSLLCAISIIIARLHRKSRIILPR